MDEGLVAAVAGLGTGLSLIVAIGAQNAFVLRQGMRRAHVALIVAICATSDLVLIVAGVAGVGAVVGSWPTAVTVVTWLGGVFLLCYGLLAARRALHPANLSPTQGPTGSARSAALTCLALTWLNPHVYLDTVVVLGPLANHYGSTRWMFGLGAVTASVLWFSALGFGARLLRRPLARPAAWRVLDIAVAVTMTALGVIMLTRA